MSVKSSRAVQIFFSGDITENITQSALENEVSPAQTEIRSLTPGINLVTAPVVTDLVVTGLTIIPPAGNTVLIMLKGDAADPGGIPIHLTDPTSLGLHSGFTSIVLEAAGDIVGVRLVWS